MQLRFGVDPIDDSGRSKFDYLAISCARRMRNVSFGPREGGCIPVVQCGDGVIIAPSGYADGSYVVICHDMSDAYDGILRHASRIVCIGFERPGCTSFATYPLDECDLHRIPRGKLTVYGGIGNVPDDGVGPDGVISFNSHGGGRPFNMGREMLSFYYRSAGRLVHCGNGSGTGYLGAMAAYHCGGDAEFPNGGRPVEVTRMPEFVKFMSSLG